MRPGRELRYPAPPVGRAARPAASLALLLALGACGPGPGPAGRPTARPGPGARTAASPPAGDLLSELRASLRKNVRQYGHKLRRCHELAMAEDRRVGGVVTLTVVVAPAGVVVDTRVAGNGAGSALLARCLMEVTKSFVFPASEGRHRLPLRLRFRTPPVKLTVRLDDVPARAYGGKGVSVKALLGPHSVTGDRIGLAVARLEPGRALALGGLGQVVGVHVLQGAVRLEPGAATRPARPGAARRRRPPARAAPPRALALAKGEAASLGDGDVASRLINPGTVRAAVILFLAPGAGMARLRGAAPAPPPAAAPGPRGPRTGPALLRANPTAVTVDLTVGPAALPTPRAVEVQPGRKALVNPTRAPMHHALLVTEGALWITVEGVRLPAEAGMAIYLPGGVTAEATPALRQPGRFVIMPWPGAGDWRPRATHPLVRFDVAPLPRPLPPPPTGVPFRLPGAP